MVFLGRGAVSNERGASVDLIRGYPKYQFRPIPQTFRLLVAESTDVVDSVDDLTCG